MSKPKYKVGDYVTSHRHIFLEIAAVIEGTYPLYGYINPKASDKVYWESEPDFDNQGLVKGKPDFASFAKLSAGDVLKIGDHNKDSNEYATVMARVGDLVMLSHIPHSHEQNHVLEKISEQLAELTGESEVKQAMDFDLDRHSSVTKSRKSAAGWESVRNLALYNWTIVKE